jgi:hypothetical protein
MSKNRTTGVCLTDNFRLYWKQGRIQGGFQGFRTPSPPQKKKGKKEKGEKGREREREREVEKGYL